MVLELKRNMHQTRRVNVMDWSDVEFAATPLRPRKAQDFLPILTDLLTFWDFVACAAAGKIALAFYARYVLATPLDYSASGPFWRDILFGSLIAALVLRSPAAELRPCHNSTSRLVLVAARKCFMAFAILIAVGLATRATDDLARLWLLSWLGIFALTVACTRLAAGRYLGRLQRRGALREAVAVMGPAGIRERMAARIAGEVDVVGLFGTDMPDFPLPGQDDELDQLLHLGREGGVHSVILAVQPDRQAEIGRIVERLKALPVQVALCADDCWAGEATPQMRMLGGIAMSVVADRPIKRWDLLAKMLVDKVGALLLLALLAPLLLAVALAVAASGPGPVIFRQTRSGWCGRDFVIFKFRTMHTGPAASGGQTRRGDPRCTRVGRLLRASSLDELPQLWNVLRGDMSLVGPRPHAAALHDIDRAGREIVAEYAQRHRVKPGLTGWAQVNGARGATHSLAQMRRRVDYDLYYIENWSLLLDLKILLKTPLCAGGENAF